MNNDSFQKLKQFETVKKRSRSNAISIQSMQCQLAEGCVKPSKDQIKKTNSKYKISSLEHYKSFEKLIPFLEEYKNLNPGFQYKGIIILYNL
jgi:hypothetical protein